MFDNDFRLKTIVLLRAAFLAERGGSGFARASGASHAKPATLRRDPEGKPLFTIYAYSIEQARALVTAKIAGETIVVAVAMRLTSPLSVASDGASR
ncbi:hypothetical protein [Bradyrhizobium sp. WSM2254]|uniref:hypothetical protein n=1 Tax=Bradyrhizobium sp. WSM2254 TaxID=1188263 RepID=UPI0012EB42EC|nr:hypothetical protein [Bradyrhizobium sp. WSM2254]